MMDYVKRVITDISNILNVSVMVPNDSEGEARIKGYHNIKDTIDTSNAIDVLSDFITITNKTLLERKSDGKPVIADSPYEVLGYCIGTLEDTKFTPLRVNVDGQTFYLGINDTAPVWYTDDVNVAYDVKENGTTSNGDHYLNPKHSFDPVTLVVKLIKIHI